MLIHANIRNLGLDYQHLIIFSYLSFVFPEFYNIVTKRNFDFKLESYVFDEYKYFRMNNDETVL